MSPGLLSIFSMALMFGIVHALDADHIAVVTGLSVKRGRFLPTLNYCLRWSLGHGSSLLIIAVLLFMFQLSLPTWLSQGAETLAGVILLIIGVLLVRQIFSSRLQFSVHRHADNSIHAHLHDERHSALSEHRATLIGVVHGLAGSAPVMVMIPLSQADNVFYAILYVAIFSFGVVLSMLIFGGLLGSGLQWLAGYGQRLILGVRSIAALFAFVVGSQLILQTWVNA